MAPNPNRLDASESVFFKRQLEAIDKELYQTIYPENKARSLIPTQQGIPDWASVYTWRKYDQFGKAKIISDMASDLPRADATGEETSKIIKNLGASYGFNIFELKAAARTGTPLDRMKASSARFAIDNEMDEILAIGNADHGLEGLLNLTGAGAFVLADKAGGGKAWAGATSDEIAQDMFNMVAARIVALKQAGGAQFHSFTIVLPVAAYALAAQKRMGDGSSQTVLKFVLEASPWINDIQPWHRADTAGAANATRMACYPKNPLVLASIVPMEFNTLPPEQRNLEFVVNALASTGGVVCRYPVAVAYADTL